MKELIKLQNISKIYEGKKVLYDVSFSINEGEIITIIGPNGSGKSTLAKILIGIIKPSSGTRELRKEIKISYMPQKIVINYHLPITVKRFLKLNQNDEHQIELMCRELNIEDLLENQIISISGGEMQRVLLARCLLSNPDVIVMDEPMQGVDVNGQIWFYEKLTKFKNEKKYSLIMISHDLYMVMKATDKVLCLNHHICCYGTPEDIKNNPSYIETFGLKALSSLALYSHAHDHSHQHDNKRE